MAANEIVKQNINNTELLLNPGDNTQAYVTETGNLIQKIDTKDLKATARTYTKKGGKGKTTYTIMEPRS